METIPLVDLMLVLGAELIQDYVPDFSYRYNVLTSIIVVISSVKETCRNTCICKVKPRFPEFPVAMSLTSSQ